MATMTAPVTTVRRENIDRLPDCCSEGAIILEHLKEAGKLEGIAEHFQIRRQGGYPGLDVFIFLVLLYSSHLHISIKEFYRRMRPWSEHLGAIAERQRLPTPASISRMLGVVEPEVVDGLNPWLLFEAAEGSLVLNRPTAVTRDGVGDTWHVFDLDDTSTVLRRRGLPMRPGFPEARRRSWEEQPGYTGRKRGDVKMSRTTLAHAGSALWLGSWMAPGNGRWRQNSRKAVDVVAHICRAIDHPKSRALMRADGAGGNFPFASACEAQGIRYLARYAQYAILERPEVRDHMAATAWHWVDDALSGPRRQAADLGDLQLYCTDGTTSVPAPEGHALHNIACRLIASRYPADAERGDGVVIEGWRYELFITNLHQPGWTAAAVVTTYMERSTLENRFEQEDRELDLDRVLSYHVDGQGIANLIGLFVWNLRVVLGDILMPQDSEAPRQVACADASVDPATAPAPLPACQIGESATPPTVMPQQAPSALEPMPTDDTIQTVLNNTEENRRNLAAILSPLDWPRLLASTPGWAWNSSVASLTCPAGVAVPLASVKIDAEHIGQLRFAAPSSACHACALRATCMATTVEKARKVRSITIPRELAQATKEKLAIFRQHLPAKTLPRDRRRRPRAMVPLSERWSPPKATSPSPFVVSEPTFLPALPRATFARVCADVEVIVRLQQAIPQRVEPPSHAPPRRHLRRSWRERLMYNQGQTAAAILFALGFVAAEVWKGAVLTG